jgi:hypothetical protein
VPIPLRLRDRLVEHKLVTGRDGDQLLFGRTGSDAFKDKNLRAEDQARSAAVTAQLLCIESSGLHEMLRGDVRGT